MIFEKNEIVTLSLANDYNPSNRVALLIAKTNSAKTIFIEHAMTGADLPPLKN